MQEYTSIIYFYMCYVFTTDHILSVIFVFNSSLHTVQSPIESPCVVV